MKRSLCRKVLELDDDADDTIEDGLGNVLHFRACADAAGREGQSSSEDDDNYECYDAKHGRFAKQNPSKSLEQSWALQSNLLPICDVLVRWYPFGTQPEDIQAEAELIELVRHHQGTAKSLDHGDLIRTRKLMDHLSQEESHIIALNDAILGERLKRYYMTYDVQRRKHSRHKATKLERAMSPANVEESLSRTCGCKTTSCNEPFRLATHALCTWRWAFFCLDKQSRMKHFVRMYKDQLLPHAESILSSPSLRASAFPGAKYSLLGQEVCRKGFLALVGVADSVMQKCLG